MRSGSEEPVPLHEEFIYCCGAATHVLKCGPWKDLSKDESKNLPRLLFMIIPGNPGLAGYYRTFIQALYCGLNQQYPVWVVSHAGHCKPPSGMEMIEDTDIKELEDVFGLNGQVEHKLNFLKNNVSKDIKLVLIAHSIGCYITLEMMKRASELQIGGDDVAISSLKALKRDFRAVGQLVKESGTQVVFLLSIPAAGNQKEQEDPADQYLSLTSYTQVLRSVLLFPTIERMAQSPQGKLMTPLLCKLRYALYMPVYLLSFLPEGVKASLVRFALRGMKSCDESSITTSINLFSVDCIANILYMASQEMMKVVERDSTTIKQNLKKTRQTNEPGSASLQRIQSEAKGDRARDWSGDKATTWVQSPSRRACQIYDGRPAARWEPSRQQTVYNVHLMSICDRLETDALQRSLERQRLKVKDRAGYPGAEAGSVGQVPGRVGKVVSASKPRLIFYYGTGDSWCPQHYYDEIKMDFPDGDIRLCEKGLRHAFVLDASKEMAAMITDWLQDDLTKL
ncbi:lipid droplet-associated hydrolase isoform X2 [Willisornis vidua]|uniref:Lipid droplet-associated hydrolase n=1 Tax=Willisornis vidua TaxID=1566151 RepID=A0ABQ9DP92_9PASS|nr:lipid droplet-associated hydrolase isoform X2 [Willisornis vidua]